MNNFWTKLFYRKTDPAELKKTINDKDWKNPNFLHGVISSLLNDIETLQTENKQLREGKGRWLKPEDIVDFNETLKSLEL